MGIHGIQSLVVDIVVVTAGLGGWLGDLSIDVETAIDLFPMSIVKGLIDGLNPMQLFLYVA